MWEVVSKVELRIWDISACLDSVYERLRMQYLLFYDLQHFGDYFQICEIKRGFWLTVWMSYFMVLLCEYMTDNYGRQHLIVTQYDWAFSRILTRLL
jgi:hypothetical protein